MIGKTNDCFGYTIFKDPKDAPGHYVLRGWDIGEGGEVLHTAEAVATPISDLALETLRKTMIEMGLICFPRSPDDDPVIVESWI